MGLLSDALSSPGQALFDPLNISGEGQGGLAPQEIPSWLQPYYENELLPQATNTFQQQMEHPFNQWQNQAINQQQDYAQNVLPGMVGETQAGYQNFMAGAQNPFNNPALAQSISGYGDLLGRNFQENILPGISDQSAATGNYFAPSGQGIAEGIAARGAQEDFSRNASNMVSNAYQQGQRNYLSGLGQAGSMAGLGLLPADVLMGTGTLIQNKPWELMSQYGGILSGAAGAPPSTFTNPLGGALGGASAGASFGPWGALAGGILGAAGSQPAQR